jgi:hypothetical protein
MTNLQFAMTNFLVLCMSLTDRLFLNFACRSTLLVAAALGCHAHNFVWACYEFGFDMTTPSSGHGTHVRDSSARSHLATIRSN